MHASNVILYKGLQIIKSNIYVIKLPLDFSIISIFNTKDLVIYKLQHPIYDDPFDILTLLSLLLAQKKHINATLDAQVVFISDDEIQ